MNKPEALRTYLTTALPWLQENPDRLQVSVGEGGIVSTEEAGLSFEWRYMITLIFTDLPLHPDMIAVPLLDWVRENQSELMGNRERRDGIRFEAGMLVDDKISLSIKLPLTERVGVHLQDGNHVVEHYAEPKWEEAFP